MAVPAAQAVENGRIAFTAKRRGGNGIVTIRPDGTRLKFRAGSNYHDATPSWSPDGQTIAFSRIWGFDEGWSLMMMDANGDHKRRITPRDQLHSDADPSWSPDGRTLVFTRVTERGRGSDNPRQIFRVDVDGTNLDQLTSRRRQHFHARWAPDGEWILYERGFFGEKQVFRMRPDGSEKQRLTPENDYVWHEAPEWAPDGTRFAVEKSVVHSEYDIDTKICIFSEDGQRQGCPIRNGYQIAWSPDGSKIAFLRRSAIYKKDLATGEVTLVFDRLRWISGLDWQPV